MLYVAVDPGGTTGFSLAEAREIPALAVPGTERGPSSWSVSLPPGGDQLPPQEFGQWLEQTTTTWREELTLIVEKFTISQRTLKVSRGGSYDALEVIGICRYLSLRDCGRDLEMSQPSEVMQLFPDTWLRERGWYPKGQPHAADSMRHLARALAKRGLIRVSG